MLQELIGNTSVTYLEYFLILNFISVSTEQMKGIFSFVTLHRNMGILWIWLSLQMLFGNMCTSYQSLQRSRTFLKDWTKFWRLEGKPQCISVLRGSLSGQWHFLPSLLILHDVFMARTSGELPIVVCDKVINARMTEECWCWRYVALNVIGSLELEGTFKGYLVQLPCHSQGHLRFDQVPRTWSSLTLKFLHWRKDKNPLSFQKSGAGCTSTPCMFLCRCCQIPFFTKLSQPIWDIWL